MGKWQPFLKLESAIITGYWGSLEIICTSSSFYSWGPETSCSRGQDRTGTQPLDPASILYQHLFITFLTFSTVNFPYNLSKREALSLKAIWAARNSWEFMGICGNLCVHLLPRPFCRVAARDQVAWHEIWDLASFADCKHQPLIPEGHWGLEVEKRPLSVHTLISS